MAYHITHRCIGCTACAQVCPSQAVVVDGTRFRILATRCLECAGESFEPQCGAICPVEEAIVDSAGGAVNPLGSLTAIPIVYFSAGSSAP